MSDIEGKVTRVGASERGQRTSLNGANGISEIEGKVTRAGASERGQRTSFKIGCCNFCKGLFLKAAWRWKEYGNGANGMSDMAGKAGR
jgi:hypothetical protein